MTYERLSLIVASVILVVGMGLGVGSVRRTLRDGFVEIRRQRFTRQAHPLTFWSDVAFDLSGLGFCIFALGLSAARLAHWL